MAVIRSAAGELPQVDLGDALAVCVAMRKAEPHRFERAALGDYQGLDAQGSVFRPFFTLANPGGDTAFPNPGATDEFINSAF